MKNRQRRLALLLSVSLIGTALTGCGQKEVEEVAEDIAIVEASNPEVGDLKLTGEFVATIEPEDTINVMAKDTGEVLTVNVEVGDVVEEGMVLATLDDRIAQITLKTAQVGVSTAQLSYDAQYGEAADTLLDMQTDTTMDTQEDYVTDNQDLIVEAMDDLDYYKSKLKSAEDELDELRDDYGFKDDVQEIMDYTIDNFDPTDPDEIDDYTKSMARYDAAQKEYYNLTAEIATYKNTIDTLQKTIEDAEDNIDKYYELYAKTATSTELQNGPIREDQKAVSQNSIENAQLSAEKAQIALDNCTITAPVSGVIESVNLDEHSLASGVAFTISQKDAMFATYYVSEDIRNTFEIGQEVTLTKDNDTYTASITEIGCSVDATTGLFKVKALVDGKTDKLLSGTKVTVTTNTYHENDSLIIPYDAVYYEGDQSYVYLAVDGYAKKTYVTTGLSSTDSIVITDGLTKDDVVITTWAAQLRDGVKVSIQDPNKETEEATSTESATGAEEEPGTESATEAKQE